MLIKQRYLIIVIIICSILLISGCESKNEKDYKKLAKEYYTIYFDIIRGVEIDEDVESLKKLQTEDTIKKIDAMKNLLENIRELIPNDDPVLLERYESRVDNLRFLSKIGSDFRKMSYEQRCRYDSVFVSVCMDNAYYKEEDFLLLMY